MANKKKYSDNFIKYRKAFLRTGFLLTIIFFAAPAFTMIPSGAAGKANIAGCDLSISAHNGSSTDIIKMYDLSWKIKGGWWATVIPNPPAMGPGASIHHTFHALFDCSVNRRYRFKLSRNGGHKSDYIYIPSETGWTTETDVNIGDVSTLF